MKTKILVNIILTVALSIVIGVQIGQKEPFLSMLGPLVILAVDLWTLYSDWNELTDSQSSEMPQ